MKGVVVTADTLTTVVETILLIALIIPPEFASNVLPFIFFKEDIQ
jgi:hypothetical protein